MKLLKTITRHAFTAAGLSISKLSSRPKSPLLHHQIDVLLDVGANAGQYARAARAAGYRGRIVSFEPLPVAHQQLSEAARNDAEWHISPRCAVGAAIGTVEINVAGNSASSSILPMLGAHAAAAPHSAYVGSATTDLITLDSVFERYVKPADKVYLKVDTQGFEAEVLKGLRENLARIEAIEIELSTVPLYGGQMLYDYFFKLLRDNGFDLWSLDPGFNDPVSGRLLQFDGVFVRRDRSE